MKSVAVVAVLFGASAFAVSMVPQYHSAANLNLRLAPRSSSSQAPPTSLTTLNGTEQKNFTFDELFTLQKRFLDNFVSPNNAVQAKSINSTLLAENVQGRVDITRTFDGRELNTEYLFGLFANLASSVSFSLLGIPESYEIVHFAASQNIASALTRFNFFFPALNTTQPIMIQTWNVFDAAGQISEYDASFTGWWQWAVDTLEALAQQELSLTTGKNITLPETIVYIQDKLATSICATAEQYCVGPLQQYENTASCHNFLTTQIRYGSAYELGRNTELCRMVHQNMVPLRPEVHCPHIGPSGGGYCIDTPSYAATISANYFTNFKFAYGNASLSG